MFTMVIKVPVDKFKIDNIYHKSFMFKIAPEVNNQIKSAERSVYPS